MKMIIVMFAMAALPALAQQKPCEELKTEIAAKLDAKGVKGYQLDIIPTADVKDQTIVGSCEAGSKKIAYTRGATAPAATSPKAEKAPAPPAKK